MSATIVTPEAQPEAPVFDAKAHVEARMQGKPAPIQNKAIEPAAPEAKPAEPERKADTTRSERRRLRAAEERTASTVLKVLKESGVIPDKKPEEAKAVTAEPKRADFPAGDEGTAQFLRATQKYDREQEAKTAETKNAEQAELAERFAELDAKTKQDIEKLFPDWDKLSAEWAANEDIQAIKYDDIPTVIGLLANSDLRAHVQYHWAKNPEEFLELCEMKPDQQIRAFHRLEGRLEKEYASVQKAAQAAEPEKEQKDRKHLAEAEAEKAKPGEPAAGGQPAKPRPSSEVVARGGSPPPDEPPIGSAAWMAKRNQRVYGK